LGAVYKFAVGDFVLFLGSNQFIKSIKSINQQSNQSINNQSNQSTINQSINLPNQSTINLSNQPIYQLINFLMALENIKF